MAACTYSAVGWLGIREHYDQAQAMRKKGLSQYILEPNRVWLRDLIDLDDSVLGAALLLDEFLENGEEYACRPRNF